VTGLAAQSLETSELSYNRAPILLRSKVIRMNATTVSPSAATPPSPANIQLMQLTMAYVTSRCLHIIAELGVADAIADQPQSTEALAQTTGTQPYAL